MDESARPFQAVLPAYAGMIQDYLKEGQNSGGCSPRMRG